MLNSLKVASIPGEQREVVDESDAGDQAIRHSDGLALPLKKATDKSRPLSRRAIKRQNADGLKQAQDRLASLSGAGSAEQFEARNRGRL